MAEVVLGAHESEIDSGVVAASARPRAAGCDLRSGWRVANITSVLGVACASLCFVAIVEAESPDEEETKPLVPLEGVAEDLLGREVPGPQWADVLNARIKAGEPIPAWPAVDIAPADDGPPAKHLAYWSRFRERDKAPTPSPAAREKLLTAVLSNPTNLGAMLRFLPKTDEAARKLAGVLELLPAEPKENREVHKQARAWIFQHSGLMRDRVMADAVHADWEQYVHDERPDWALAALQQREPETATKLFTEWTAGVDFGIAVVAGRLLLEHADAGTAPKWREWLIAAAANPKFPEKAREIAAGALVKAEWKGREEWILTILKHGEDVDPEWFIREMWRSKDRWIPKLTRMIGGKNRRAHERAVHLLTRIGVRADALRPLLPWLDDPQWGGDQYYQRRFDLFQGLDEVKLPEAVPALKRSLLKESDASFIGAAAKALAFHKVKDAVPIMKTALNRAESWRRSDDIVSSIHKLRSYSPEEIVDGLECYFIACSTEKQRDEFFYHPETKSQDARVWIGKYFAKEPPISAALADRIGKRSKALAPEQPQLASNLLDVMLRAKAGDVSGVTAVLLAKGQITTDQLEQVLHRCRKPGWRAGLFQPLVGTDGAVGGFAAVLASDRKALASILAGKDHAAQEAVLAATRLAGDELEIKAVVQLLDSEDETVAEAADDYLRSYNQESRLALLKHARSSADDDSVNPWDPSKGKYGAYESLVKHSMKEYSLATGPDEVFRLVRFSNGGSDGSWTVLAYTNFGVAFRETRDGRSGYAKLDKGQMNRIRGYVKKYRVDELPSLEQPIEDGVHYGYTHQSRDEIRGLNMNNPPTGRSSGVPSVSMFDGDERYSKGIVIYGQLVNLFDDLFRQLSFKWTYGDAVEFLIPRENAGITAVWKQGDDLRVLVGDYGSMEVWLGVDIKTWYLTGLAAEPPESKPAYVLDPSTQKLKTLDAMASLPSYERPLQVAADGGLWAADGSIVFDGTSTSISTEILRYDTKDTTHRSIRSIKGVAFDSGSMWVDEAEGMIYVAANGDLVRIPLKP